MSNSTNESNDRLVARIDGVSIHADTPAGAAYVKKVCHPPTTIPADYQGVPDCSQPNVVCVEVKAEANFLPQITVPTGSTTNATINASSMLVVAPSGGRVGAYVFLLVNSPLAPTANGWVQPIATPTGTNPINQTCAPALINRGYSWGNFIKDVAKFRTTYKSLTHYLNATAFNDQGTVTSAKFKPNIVTTTFFSAYAEANRESRISLLKAMRSVGAAVHFKKKASSDYVITGKKLDEVEDAPEIDTSLTADYGIQFWELQDNSGGSITQFASPFPFWAVSNVLPQNASDVLTFSSKAATRPAKEGALTVQQPIGPLQEWTDNMSGVGAGAFSVNSDQIPLLSFIRIATYGGSVGVTFQQRLCTATQSLTQRPAMFQVTFLGTILTGP